MSEWPTKSDLAANVKAMRDLGIKRLCLDGRGYIEIELEASCLPAPIPEPAPAPTSPEDVAALTEGPPEGDDALFWSIPGPLPSEARSADQPPQE